MEVLIAVLAILVGYWLYYRRPKNFPPGPWRVPVLGSLLSVGEAPYKRFTEWKRTYGPVVGLDFGSFPTVAVSDWRLIKECLVHPSCQGRPDLQPFLDRSGGVRRGILFSDGDQWVEQRRFTHKILKDLGWSKTGNSTGKSMDEIVGGEIADWLHNFKDEGQPVCFLDKFYVPALNASWIFLAGERMPHDDPKVRKLWQQVAANLENYSGQTELLMFIPWFTRLFPYFSGYDKMMEDLLPVLEFFQEWIDQHKSTRIPGQPRDFIDTYLDKINETTDPLSSFYGDVGETSLKTVMLDIFFAGTESFCTTMNWLLLYLSANPKVQDRLLAEIDSVIGSDRAPTLSDRPNMPYLEAVMFEITRISSLAPIGLFRRVTENTKIGGFDVPKDTMLILNYYDCNHDPEYWGDPENFRPERFLGADNKIVKHEPYAAFGGGKRTCPGEVFAKEEMFLYVTNLLQRYRIELDPENPNVNFEPQVSFLLTPKKHKLVLQLRH